jgi:hypothetical protein
MAVEVISRCEEASEYRGAATARRCVACLGGNRAYSDAIDKRASLIDQSIARRSTF